VEKKATTMTSAYIGLGSNLNDPVLQLLNALQSLQEIPLSKLVKYSSFYRSKALGPQRQPDYINAVAQMETALTAFSLLHEMQSIETRYGRVRGKERWGPRTLDLDLLVFGSEEIHDIKLIVPHPEIANRNFVLSPLVEICSEMTIPGLGFAKDLLNQLDTDELEKIKLNE